MTGGDGLEHVAKLLESLSNPILTACGIYIAKSLHGLNIKIAVVIQTLTDHDHRLNRLEKNEDKQGD